MQERSNDRETFREQVGRVLQLNMVGALIDEAQAPRVVKLLTEYNALTGLTLDQQTVFQPDNFPSFVRWMYARINTLAKLMSERTRYYQTVIGGKAILRHTDVSNLRVALSTTFYEMIRSMAIPVTFDSSDLTLPQFKEVNYWQSIEKPLSIDVTPTYTDTNGAVKQGMETKNDFVVGLLHDKDAIGYSVVNSWNAATPLEIHGGYWNESWHEFYKSISDNTEKAIVLLLE